MDTVLITGTVFEADGETPKSGGTLKVRKVTKGGQLISKKALTVTIGSEGEVSFTLPRDCEAWIDGPIWGFEKRPGTGVRVDIPDVAEYEFRLLVPGSGGGSTNASQAALNSEISARIAADENLQEQITELGAGGAWGEIQGSLSDQTDLTTALASKAEASDISELSGEVGALTDDLAAEVSARSAAVSAEATARANADAALTTSLETVSDAVSAVDAALDAETSARQSADTTLQTNITNEASARVSGDSSTLSSANAYTDTQVAAEASARATAVSSASTADRARGNHTGTQTASTISDFASAVAALIAAHALGTAPVMLSSTEVDLNEGTGAKQPLYACPADRKCVVTEVTFRRFSAGAVVVQLGMGWNASADDVAADLFPTGLTTEIFSVSRAGASGFRNPAAIGSATEVFGLAVFAPEGSALTARVDVFGYLTDTSGVPVVNILVP